LNARKISVKFNSELLKIMSAEGPMKLVRRKFLHLAAPSKAKCFFQLGGNV